MLRILFIVGGFLVVLFTTSCFRQQPVVGPGGQVFVERSGQEVVVIADPSTLEFKPHEIIVRPGQDLKIKVVNQLSNEKINFLILSSGDDPIVVSHLARQMSTEAQGWLPSADYYIARAPLLSPSENAKIKLQVPGDEGIYYFVSTVPGQEERLKGRLVVRKHLTNLNDEDAQEEDTTPRDS